MLLFDFEAAIKQAALLFDGICLAGMPVFRFLEDYIGDDKGNKLSTMRAKHDWLLEKGVLVSAPPEFGSEYRLRELLGSIFDDNEGSEKLRRVIVESLQGPDGESLIEATVSRVTRRAARRLEEKTKWNTIVFGTGSHRHEIFKPGKDAVIHVVLKSIPLPHDGTAWEDIIEWRNDPEARKRYLRLKHWMNTVVSENRSPQDLHDEIQMLLAEYEDYVKLHCRKLQIGILETFVTTSAEVLEGLVKLKLSDAARALFSLKRRDVELLEAERLAPGRQLAYIAQARGRFLE